MAPICISTETDEDEAEELREDWARRVASGRPMMTYEVDTPVSLKLNAQGQLDIDCPCLRVEASDLAGVLRMRLGPVALSQLLRFVQDLTLDLEPPCLH